MNKLILGILVGICAGIIDVLPMIAQGLSWDADVSAFSMWVVVGFLISTNNLKINGFIKGLIIAYAVILPIGIIVGSKEPMSLIPIGIMTFVLGSISGFVIEKFGR